MVVSNCLFDISFGISGPLFLCEGGILTLSDTEFKTNSANIITMREEGTIQLSAQGTVIVQHFVAKDITGCEKPLFHLSGDATLHMSQSTFENVLGKEAIFSTSIGKLTFIDTKSIGSTLLRHTHESAFDNFITFETGTLTMEILELIQDPTELITADVVYTLFQESMPSMVPLQQPSNSDASMVSLTDDAENTFTGCIVNLDVTASSPAFTSVSACTLSLTSCYITSTTATISRPLIQGSFSLTMNSVVFSSISTSASSLISLTDAASFTLMGNMMGKVPTFSNMVSSGDGIIHLDNVVRVMIMSCVFDHCHSKNGGAMFIKQRANDGNTPECEQWDISIFCTHCTADECGGGLYLSIWHPLMLGGCAYHCCSAKEGGAIFVEMAGAAQFIDGAMSMNIFTMQPELRYEYNTASVRGGSVCIIGSTLDEQPLQLLVGGLSGNFIGGVLNQFGSDVFIDLTVTSQQILENFANEFHNGLRSTSDHSTDTDQYPQVRIETPSGEPIRFSRLPPFYLDTMGMAWNGCFMNVIVNCARLEMYLDRIQTKDQDGRYVVNEIQVTSEIASFQATVITKQSVKLIRGVSEIHDPYSGQFEGNQSIVIDSPSEQQNQLLFSLMADGTLELNDLSILMDEDLTLCAVCDNTARFIISASTLIFTGDIIQFTPLTCYFGSLEILNTCLKSQSQATPIPCTCPLVYVIAALALSNSNSESTELETVTAITINSSTFEDFRNGKPVIAISDASYMEIHNPTFTNCMDKDDSSKKAKKLEINGPNLYETIDPDLWSINFDTHDEDEELYFWTTDPSASYDFLKDVTLKIYLEPYKASTIYTKTEGINAIFCGNGSLSGVALIESWSDVVVDGCRFSSISRSTGLGSVIEANISLSTVFKILHTTFENCQSASTTNWILLKGLNTKTSQVSSWEGTLSHLSDRSGVMVTSDESNTYSLIDILFPAVVSSTVFVGGRGIDDRASCGDESTPCRTISIGFEVGLTRKDPSEAVAVSLVGQAGFGGCVWVGSESLLITASMKRTRLQVENELETDGDGSGVVNVGGGSVTFSALTLLLTSFASPNPPARPVSLVFGSGTVFFSDVLVSQSSTRNVDLGLCWIIGGSLSMEGLQVSEMEMSEGVCLIFAMSEAKPIQYSMINCEITHTTSNNSPLIVLSSSSPLSQFQIIDCSFSHMSTTLLGTLSESASSLVSISTNQMELSVEDVTFEECWMNPSASSASILHVTVFAQPSQSVSTINIIRCKFLSSQSASLPPSFIHFTLHSSHVSVLFEDSLFSESSQRNAKGGVLIECGSGLPIVVRRRTVFKHCTLILSEIIPHTLTRQNSKRDEL